MHIKDAFVLHETTWREYPESKLVEIIECLKFQAGI